MLTYAGIASLLRIRIGDPVALIHGWYKYDLEAPLPVSTHPAMSSPPILLLLRILGIALLVGPAWGISSKCSGVSLHR